MHVAPVPSLGLGINSVMPTASPLCAVPVSTGGMLSSSKDITSISVGRGLDNVRGIVTHAYSLRSTGYPLTGYAVDDDATYEDDGPVSKDHNRVFNVTVCKTKSTDVTSSINIFFYDKMADAWSKLAEGTAVSISGSNDAVLANQFYSRTKGVHPCCIVIRDEENDEIAPQVRTEVKS